MTPGYTTSEFWATLLSDVVAALALFHIGMPANTQPYVSAVALLASGIATAIYTHSRQQVKVASLAAVPPTQPTTPAPTPPASSDATGASSTALPPV